MKLYVARCTTNALTSLEGYSEALGALLEAEGHKVQFLELPPVSAPGRSLTNIASLRLWESAPYADTLICLDAISAVLQHPRKIVFLLDDTYLDSDRSVSASEPAGEREYLANLLKVALGEAKAIFVPSRFAGSRLRFLANDRWQLLQPHFAPSKFRYARNPGPELLVLNPLNDRQRPELLIDCLAELPESFRVRWVASYRDAATLVRVVDLARNAGIEHRVAFDVRSINDGEKAYLLAHAAALLELAPAKLAVSDSVHHANQIGVPVISCSDGGALAEGTVAYPRPDGAALATAIRSVCPATLKPSVSRGALRTSWAPLLEAIGR